MDIKNLILTWGMAIANVIFNSYGTLALKYVINSFGKPEITSVADAASYAMLFLKSPLAISSFLALIAGTIFMMIAFQRMDVSIAYPAIMGMNFMAIAVVGSMLFGEPFSLMNAWGIVLALASIYCFTRN